ncbi:MAG TPA: hypothetical protein VL068_11325, partial [Microthrixaceae bacterium]|nr:hypothetical protein [Microthrixaceae bacterium]
MTPDSSPRPDSARKTRGAADRPAQPRGAADRVAQVHAQARPTFVLAALFAVAAVISAVVPHDTGIWLPLHLFLVGSVLGSILAATQLLAVTWSASPAPANWLANTQRVLLFGGVTALAIGREVDFDALTGLGGATVVAALGLLIFSLIQVRNGAVTDRYRPAIHGYCGAAAFGIIGTTLGTALASGAFTSTYANIRGIHIAANALGLVGIVIASTLPYFIATQARMKMSKAATPARVHVVVTALSASTLLTMAGWAIDVDAVAAASLWAYAISILGLVTLMPRMTRKQFDWAGPRLVQLGSGFVWWIIAVVLLGANALFDEPSLNSGLRVLVVGGYAQILFASLAYFAPVILAGKRKPGDGLRITRSWVAVVAANVAAVGALIGQNAVLTVGIIVWL